jgi:hypothetical protein
LAELYTGHRRAWNHIIAILIEKGDWPQDNADDAERLRRELEYFEASGSEYSLLACEAIEVFALIYRGMSAVDAISYFKEQESANTWWKCSCGELPMPRVARYR